jgi:UDP-3-O-[3-hydroxymyristoyl] glucosamine N-acyltransferase
LIVRHAGGVVIGPEVLILAGAVVAKSLYARYTQIGDSSQIGIMANIGHGVTLGTRCVISSHCVIAGRCALGDRVWMGVSSSIGPGLTVGAGAQIKMGSVVVQSVPEGQTVSGNFAIPHTRNIRQMLKGSR